MKKNVCVNSHLKKLPHRKHPHVWKIQATCDYYPLPWKKLKKIIWTKIHRPPVSQHPQNPPKREFYPDFFVDGVLHSDPQDQKIKLGKIGHT